MLPDMRAPWVWGVNKARHSYNDFSLFIVCMRHESYVCSHTKMCDRGACVIVSKSWRYFIIDNSKVCGQTHEFNHCLNKQWPCFFIYIYECYFTSTVPCLWLSAIKFFPFSSKFLLHCSFILWCFFCCFWIPLV